MSPSPSPYFDGCDAVASAVRCVVIDPQQMAVMGAMLHALYYGIGAIFGLMIVWAAWRMLLALRGVKAS